MGAAQEPFESLAADLLAGAAGVRDALRQRLASARAVGDAAAAARAATLLVLHTLADFADFRGLADAWPAFDAVPPQPADELRACAVRLGRASLDHAFDHDDPALAPVRAHLFDALRSGHHLPADERVLLAKLLVDHDSMRNDMAACARVLALMQDVVPAAHPRWQATWWRLAAETHDYTGQPRLAQAANAQLRALLPRLDWPEAVFALACEELRQALSADDFARAERAWRAIEQQRPAVRPALLPHGLRVQAALHLRRGEYNAALARTQLMLELCEDHEVPLRDRAGYVEQRAHALAGLGRHAEAVALLESLRPTQVGGQADVLEAIIAMARAVQALDEARADADALALQAVRQAAPLQFHRFLMSFPAWAARVAAIGLQAGVEVEFLTRAVRERRLVPPEPAPDAWPWALQVRAFGGLRAWQAGQPLGGQGGKAQKKPLELLALLAARPEGWDAAELIDRLWPDLEAEAPRASLEMAVARLRKWLGEPEAVRVADGRVMLHPALVWTDVAAFEAACARGDADAAVQLHAGPLVPGEPLLQPERARLSARLSALVLAAAAQRAPADARLLLARALAAEPGAGALQAALQAL